MKVLRAIGRGELNLAVSHDMQMVANFEQLRKIEYQNNFARKSKSRESKSTNQDPINLYNSMNVLDELSYLQFFNELVQANSK